MKLFLYDKYLRISNIGKAYFWCGMSEKFSCMKSVNFFINVNDLQANKQINKRKIPRSWYVVLVETQGDIDQNDNT